MKQILLLLLLLSADIFGKVLAEEIHALEGKRRLDVREKATLSLLYIYSGNYSNSARLYRELYQRRPNPEHLFNAALVSLAHGGDSRSLWTGFFKIIEKERIGKRWDELGLLLNEVAMTGVLRDEAKIINSIRELYLGKGYYMVLLMIDIYNRYGGTLYSSFLEEIRADCYYRSRYFDKARECFERLYARTGEEKYLLSLARIAYKEENYPDLKKKLDSITGVQHMGFVYYYLRARAAHALGSKEEYLQCRQKLAALVSNSKQRRLLSQLGTL